MGLLDHRIAAVDAAQDQQLVGAIGQETAEQPTVTGLHVHLLEAFTDFSARVEDARQKRVEIVPLIMGEVRANLSPFVEQLVAGRAALHVQLASAIRTAGPPLHHRTHPGDLRCLGGRLGFACAWPKISRLGGDAAAMSQQHFHR